MLIPFQNVVAQYPDPRITGILHVGGHLAEEHDDYAAQGVTNVVWVEADPEKAKLIQNRYGQTTVAGVVGDEDGEEVTFHIANNGQSSSIYEFGTHLTAHPEVRYVGTEERVSDTLQTLLASAGLNVEEEKLNFLNLDIQGAELKALRGLGDDLRFFDFIYAEVNREELYIGCARVEEIDEFLSDYDRVQTEWTPFGWGDALYVRKAS